jgi:hypothetical protein
VAIQGLTAAPAPTIRGSLAQDVRMNAHWGIWELDS